MHSFVVKFNGVRLDEKITKSPYNTATCNNTFLIQMMCGTFAFHLWEEKDLYRGIIIFSGKVILRSTLYEIHINS